MSIKEMSRVWSDSKCKGNELLLLLAIADNANDSGYCYPGIAYLAQKTRMSERTVIRMIDELETVGELAAIRRRTKGNRYMILSGCDTAEKERRMAQLTDIANPVTANLSHITDSVVGKLPTTTKEPSIKPSVTIALWESIVKTPVPSGIVLARLDYLLEEYGEAKLRGAMQIAARRVIEGGLRAVNVQYLQGILRNGGGLDVQPAKRDEMARFKDVTGGGR